MAEYTVEEITKQVEDAIRFLCKEGKLAPGALVVLGCSTSEISGGHIGKSGSPELGKAVVQSAFTACADLRVDLAVQCCEHLNRALVLSQQAASARGYRPVSAVPYPRAGGSAASAAYRLLANPVVVETIEADAGLDIGDTLIGMHLRPVAVPLRYINGQIGEAHLTMAYARPKYIGGARAHYTLDDSEI